MGSSSICPSCIFDVWHQHLLSLCMLLSYGRHAMQSAHWRAQSAEWERIESRPTPARGSVACHIESLPSLALPQVAALASTACSATARTSVLLQFVSRSCGPSTTSSPLRPMLPGGEGSAGSLWVCGLKSWRLFQMWPKPGLCALPRAPACAGIHGAQRREVRI